MNVMQLPDPNLPNGTVPGAPRSDVRLFLVFTYILQEDVAIRGGVEDTRLEAKDTKKKSEAKAKDSLSEDRHF